MSYWIELHCDVMSSKTCSNQHHDYSMNGCGNGLVTIKHCINKISENAIRKMGWKFKNNKWYCSACAKESER